MRPALVILTCMAMMAAAHVLRPRYMYVSVIEIPGFWEDGCRDQDDKRVECDDAHTMKPAVGFYGTGDK